MSLKLGDVSPLVEQIKFQVSEWIDPTSGVKVYADAFNASTESSQKFTDLLDTAIRYIQHTAGLVEDGIVGPDTANELEFDDPNIFADAKKPPTNRPKPVKKVPAQQPPAGHDTQPGVPAKAGMSTASLGLLALVGFGAWWYFNQGSQKR